ncbi:hypothetical protein A1O1_07828 [Capronia coronata CBS 617.96]|uniref:CENP-V/GFA domain-containing protein n=1 Tax=Capronia coronata CBS 617.96 TaxID=1182541 RepID=W9XNF0_9EURO|nr:uncharacterized protein A1O1_07828 [Capronia coronata CBS 617.96]EXJ81763.1 hypothetical protein A1O1_07828 [Capronia coronata CBS 617.96]
MQEPNQKQLTLTHQPDLAQDARRPDELSLTVECHCRLTSLSLAIPRSALPLKSAVCHCNSCRHATGQLFATFAVLPVELPEGIFDIGSLVRYDSSSSCERWFCKRCGASVLNVDKGTTPAEWEVGTGVLHFDDGLEGKLNRVQLWVEDVSGDGGAVVWINRGQLAGMDRHRKGRQSEMVSYEQVKSLMQRSVEASSTQGSRDGERMQVRCHCRNVAFSLAWPSQDFNHCTGKFEASLDACTSCRRVSGFEITSWITVPKQLLCVTAANSLDTFLADRTRLGHYQTSSDVSRYFCVRCGATVFYHKHNLKTIDIGVGLLDSGNEGKARAEEWLAWQPYPKGLSYPEDAVDKDFVTNLTEGMRLAEEVVD